MEGIICSSDFSDAGSFLVSQQYDSDKEIGVLCVVSIIVPNVPMYQCCCEWDGCDISKGVLGSNITFPYYSRLLLSHEDMIRAQFNAQKNIKYVARVV
jgi:hypothetical protein